MSPSKSDGCVCPSDLFQCDDILGCVCPAGVDCGIEGGKDVLINKLNQEEITDAMVSSPGPVIVAVVVSLVLLCSVLACVIVFYYRWATSCYSCLEKRVSD